MSSHASPPAGSPPPLSKSKHHLTPAEKQAQAVEKLLADPTKEIKLPNGPKEKTLRAPREMMKNVSGSSAGAGSGEFHVYKHARRREYERIKMMEDQAAKEQSTSAFLISQAQQAAKDEAKTNKNRAKRDKKKLAKEKAKLAAAQGEAGNKSQKRRRDDDSVAAADSAVAEKKIKAAPGAAGIKFRGKEDDDESRDSEAEGQGQDND